MKKMFYKALMVFMIGYAAVFAASAQTIVSQPGASQYAHEAVHDVAQVKKEVEPGAFRDPGAYDDPGVYRDPGAYDDPGARTRGTPKVA